MDPHQVDDRRLRELMDALRPGSDDLSRPEFAPLAERCQRDPQWKRECARAMRMDLAIGEALDDLPIPAGAVDRLLAKLQAAQADSAAPAAQSPATQSPVAPSLDRAVGPRPSGDSRQRARNDAPVDATRHPAAPPASAANDRSSTNAPATDVPVSRPNADTAGSTLGERTEPAKQTASVATPWRKLASLEPISAVAAVAVVICLLGAAYYFAVPVGAYGQEEILQAAQLYAISEQPEEKFDLAQHPSPEEFPPSADLVVRPTRWWPVSGLLERSGVAYELHAGGANATLYVLRRDSSWRASRLVDLQESPPNSAQSDTGGRALAAWAPGGLPERLVYLLVVEGGPQQYRAFVASSGPLAFVSPLAPAAR